MMVALKGEMMVASRVLHLAGQKVELKAASKVSSWVAY